MTAPFIHVPDGLAAHQRHRLFARTNLAEPLSVRQRDGVTVIRIAGAIGRFQGEVSARDFAKVMDDVHGDLTVDLHTGGGEVFEGIQIANRLIGYDGGGRVRVEVRALAASIGSVIMMSGSERALAPGGFVMIHDAISIMLGNRHDFEQEAKILGQLDAAIAGAYVGRTKLTRQQISKAMDDETWYDHDAALKHGFATEILGAARADADLPKFNLVDVFRNVPPALRSAAASPTTQISSRGDLDRLLRRAGLSRSAAASVCSFGFAGLTKNDADPEALAIVREATAKLKLIGV